MITHANRAVLIDYVPTQNLQPLLENRAPGMLPIGGFPLIQHWCEKLSEAGIKELMLILSNSPQQIREFVGDGSRWGFTHVNYQYHPRVDDWRDARSLTGDFQDSSTLIIDLSSLPIMQLEQIPMCSQFWSGHPALNTFSAGIRRIQSIASLWQANMDYLNGSIPPLRSADEADARGLISSPGSQVSPRSVIESTSVVGENTVVSDQVRINSSIIGNDCLIEKSSHIRMSVVFDNTYLGSHSDLNYAVVDGPLIHRIDLGITAWIDDPVILARTKELVRVRPEFMEKIIAAALLIFTLPVTLLSRKSAETIMVPAGCDHNGHVHYRSMTVTSLTTQHILLRKLPWLRKVIRGDLGLFGINRDITDLPTWASTQANQYPGIIALADLNMHEFGENDDTSILIANNYQLANANLRNNLKLLGRWTKALFNNSTRRSNP